MQARDEITIVLHFIGWGLGFIGGLLSVLISIVFWIFRQHKRDNDCRDEELREDICELRRETRNDTKEIRDQIKEII